MLEVFAFTPLDAAVCKMPADAVMAGAADIMEAMAQEGLILRQVVVHQL